MSIIKLTKPTKFVFSKPVFFNLAKKSSENNLKKLFLKNKVLFVNNNFRHQLRELFAVENPKKYFSESFETEFNKYVKNITKKTSLDTIGEWVYFPWNGSLNHILNNADFQKVRTARNKNLISDKEQQKFYNSCIGIGGLSVGNSVALTLALQGGARHIKLADHDTLELSNTNRIRTSVNFLGIPKVEMTARQIYEINPYAEIEIFPEGLNENNIEKFCNNLNIIIDEVDNLSVKYLIRKYAKKMKIPVLMGADNGDGVVIDIERYDLNSKIEFFHGRMGKVSYQKLKHLNKFGTGRMITKHVGLENVTAKMQESLSEMGKTLVSWPQLGGAALLNGSAIAYSVRKILNDQSLSTNRVTFSLDEKFQPDFFSKKEVLQRKNSAKVFKKIFNL